MNSIPCSNPEDIATHDFILIPCAKDKHKKIIKFMEYVHKENPVGWTEEAIRLLKEHTPDHGKTVIQWIGKNRIALIGIDESQSYQKISSAIRSALFKLLDTMDYANTVLIVPEVFKGKAISAMSNGLSMAYMRVNYYKQDKRQDYGSFTFFPQESKPPVMEPISEGITLAQVQKGICHLVNLPSNEKNPLFIVNWAKERFTGKKYTLKILDLAGLREEKLDALINVGKGSKTPPYLLVIRYNTKSKGKVKHIGLIGKGVTFDTGGISLKDPLNMHLMKSDMGGAAAVLGAMEMFGKMELNVQATAVIALAENAIGPDAYRPGDVISSYSGKSIEVIDTDAEGRLILADAIAYMIKNYKPQVMIDLATLTGSVIATLGYKAAGLFTNNEDLAKSIKRSAESCGERVWRLPLWEDYMEEMNSDIADIKNLATKPMAGAITAAKFLQYFTEDHAAWAHLDIAGVAMLDGEYSKQRSATAYGVLLLKQWIEDYLK